jgi:hypothetical protein
LAPRYGADGVLCHRLAGNGAVQQRDKRGIWSSRFSENVLAE